MLNHEHLLSFYQINRTAILDHGSLWAKFILIPADNPGRAAITKLLLADPNIKAVIRKLNDPIWGIPSLAHHPADYRVYGSFYWTLRFLADIGLSGQEIGIVKLINQLQLQQLEDGQFLLRYHRKKQQLVSLVCMTAHLAYCLARMGYKDTTTVHAALNYILTTQRRDGGWHCDRSKQTGERNESAPDCPAASVHVIRFLGQYENKYESIVQPTVHQLIKNYNSNAIQVCDCESRQRWCPEKLRYPPHFSGLDILNVIHSLSFFSDLLMNTQFESLISSILNRWDGQNWLRPEKRIREWSSFDFSQTNGHSEWITSLFLRAIQRVFSEQNNF